MVDAFTPYRTVSSPEASTAPAFRADESSQNSFDPKIPGHTHSATFLAEVVTM